MSAMKYPGLYFEDGDITLSAYTARGELRLFLVHRCMLSDYSPVFCNIFNEPAGVQQDDIDGIQAVDDVQLLQVNDSVEDLAAMLRCLYYPHDMPFKLEEPTVNVDLGGLLRVCKKYEIATLAVLVVNQLKFEWPTSLSVWEQHESRARAFGTAPRGQQYLDDRFPEPASIIRLAHEFGIPELLPAAFYCLSRISPSASYETYHSPATRALPQHAAKLAAGKRSARWGLLAHADLMCLAKGQGPLRAAKALTMAFGAPQRARACHCRVGCSALVATLRRRVDDTHDVLGALADLRMHVSEPEQARKLGVCPTCAQTMCGIASALRLCIWLNLPAWFEVPSVKLTP